MIGSNSSRVTKPALQRVKVLRAGRQRDELPQARLERGIRSLSGSRDYIFFNKFQTLCRHRLFNSEKFAKIRRKKHLLCLGDSHISVFKYINDHNLLEDYWIDVLVVGGATAQGMVNPNSKTSALKIFRERIGKAKNFQTILLQLGEVDCGFVIWYYAEKYFLPIEKQLDRTLTNYFAFIEEIRNRGFNNVIVLSAPLPTIRDGQDWGEITNARKEVKASLRERTNLTIQYNRLLSAYCKKNGIVFIDTTHLMLDEVQGVVKEGLLNNNAIDHHLDNKNYAKLICRAFAAMQQN